MPQIEDRLFAAHAEPSSGDVEQPVLAVESFEGFYRRELRSVTGLAYVLSGRRVGAEDIAQEAFFAAFRHWSKIGAYDNPGAWVRRVVANRAVSAHRRMLSEIRTRLHRAGDGIVLPEFSVENDHVWVEVRRLPRRQAQVIALRFVEDHTTAEIAAILGLSAPTVKTHLKREAWRRLPCGWRRKRGDVDYPRPTRTSGS
jgi:RNA polymerase sigma-70 factor (ECF subfamily)